MQAPALRLLQSLADRYRIERELGVGGMATVYLAEDLKHDRKVAIKVLKPELAAVLGAERFVVEIKTTASLSHPHILPLFDSGTADGFLFYVMPYIQGETVREKLNRETQFGIEEAVRIAREVADALDYAHRRGVIHRDIKPENILLHDGRAMVMDFGIALAVSAAAGGRMTETGLSLGTPHYMSPEQATAEKEITPRSDVYSLGSVLYEMLSGEPPHTAGSAQAVIMKILTDATRPVRELRKSVPPNVDAAVSRALEKLPADRFESARAFGEALANPAFIVGSGGAPTAHRRGARTVSMPLFAVTAGVGFLAVAGLLVSLPRTPAADPAPLMRFEVPLPDSLRVNKVVLTPDGSRLLVSTSNHGPFEYTFADARLTPLEIPGRSAITLVDLTPDGNTLVFREGVEVKAMPVSGGAVRTIGDSMETLRVSDDGYVYGRHYPRIRRFSLHTGVEEVLMPRDSARFIDDSLFGQFGEPVPVPGGRGVVLSFQTYAPAAAQMYAFDVRSRELIRVPHPALETALPIGFTPDGQLLFEGTDGVYAIPFDTRRLRATGTAERMIARTSDRGFECGGGTDCTGYALNGRSLAWVRLPLLTPALVTRRGVAHWLPNVPPNLQFNDPAAAPDGRAFVFQVWDINTNRLDLWTYRMPDGPLSRLVSLADGYLWAPRWTSDGRTIRYSAVRKDGDALFSVPSDGSRPPQEFMRRPGGLYYSIFYSPDNRRVASVACLQLKSKTECLSRDNALAVFTIGQPDSVLVVPGQRAARGVFSPDGRWLAYTARDVDREEVYAFSLDGAGSRWQVSRSGGGRPRWARDGRTIYFTANDSMYAAEWRAGAGQPVGAVRALFRLGANEPAGYDVLPGDSTFLMVAPNETEQTRVVVLANFIEQLDAARRSGSRPTR